MKKSGVKPHQVEEQVSDAKMSRRHLIQGALLSTVPASALVEAAEQSAHQGGDPKAEVEEIERKLMWLYSNDLPKHVNEIMEYFDDTPEMLQFDVMSPREFKGAAFRKHINELVAVFSSNIKVDIMDMQAHADNHLAFVSSLQHNYGNGSEGQAFRIYDSRHRLLQEGQRQMEDRAPARIFPDREHGKRQSRFSVQALVWTDLSR
jgi:ketosteroid isomerase-like protein